MDCPRCGTQLPLTAKFCAHCGVSLSSFAPQVVASVADPLQAGSVPYQSPGQFPPPSPLSGYPASTPTPVQPANAHLEWQAAPPTTPVQPASMYPQWQAAQAPTGAGPYPDPNLNPNPNLYPNPYAAQPFAVRMAATYQGMSSIARRRFAIGAIVAGVVIVALVAGAVLTHVAQASLPSGASSALQADINQLPQYQQNTDTSGVYFNGRDGFSVDQSWHVISAQQASEPQQLGASSGTAVDEVWCAVIDPPITQFTQFNNQEAAYGSYARFLLVRQGDLWTVVDNFQPNDLGGDIFPSQSSFLSIGCNNWNVSSVTEGPSHIAH